MLSGTHRVLALLVCMAAFCGCLRAQTEKTIILRMLDGKTGKLVLNSDYLIRVDHEQTVHSNWVTLNESGTGKLTLPRGAKLFTVQGTYNSSMDVYVSCDSLNGKEAPVVRWYSVADVLTTGIIAPNGCGKPSAAKLKLAARPGEFIFFVRRHSFREDMKNEYSMN